MCLKFTYGDSEEEAFVCGGHDWISVIVMLESWSSTPSHMSWKMALPLNHKTVYVSKSLSSMILVIVL